jgi:hypothetical protein
MIPLPWNGEAVFASAPSRPGRRKSIPGRRARRTGRRALPLARAEDGRTWSNRFLANSSRGVPNTTAAGTGNWLPRTGPQSAFHYQPPRECGMGIRCPAVMDTRPGDCPNRLALWGKRCLAGSNRRPAKGPGWPAFRLHEVGNRVALPGVELANHWFGGGGCSDGESTQAKYSP